MLQFFPRINRCNLEKNRSFLCSLWSCIVHQLVTRVCQPKWQTRKIVPKNRMMETPAWIRRRATVPVSSSSAKILIESNVFYSIAWLLVSETDQSTAESTVQCKNPVSDCGSGASHCLEDQNPNQLSSGSAQSALPKIYCSEYPVTQINGCRQYGPPRSWTGSIPGFGCEIYVKRIPPEFTEADLVPVFERFGKYVLIWLW